jgi:hypothetical protein
MTTINLINGFKDVMKSQTGVQSCNLMHELKTNSSLFHFFHFVLVPFKMQICF